MPESVWGGIRRFAGGRKGVIKMIPFRDRIYHLLLEKRAEETS